MMTTHKIIPCYIFEWGWETFIDFTLLEKEVCKNQTYLVIQNSHQQIKGMELGESKVFLQINRWAEINGEEFNQEEVDFAKIIIGKVSKINKLGDNPQITKTFFNCHKDTPVYHIQVQDIFNFKDYLKNPNIEKLECFLEDINKSLDLFEFKKYEYAIDYPNVLSDDLLFLRVYISEYWQKFYIISKELRNNKHEFFIRFFYEYFLDESTYYFANYLLSEDEIRLFTPFNLTCCKFFDKTQ